MSSTGTPIAGTQTWFLGTGRRKESVARVFLRAGSGKFTVNGREVASYFPNHAWKHDAIEPLKFTSLAEQVDVKVTAHGGGVGGQAGAVRMGLSRAISRFNPELRPALRKNGFLTRDSRMKERKKYGQKGARKTLPVYEAVEQGLVDGGFPTGSGWRQRTAQRVCRNEPAEITAGMEPARGCSLA